MSSNTKNPPLLNILCEEPFRIFFPLGLLFSLVGVSHWLWYHAKLIDTYSCTYHGLLQIQAFEMAFVVGFLLTALPKFLEVPPAQSWELFLAVGLLLWIAAELYLENWVPAQIAFLALVLHLLIFAARRFRIRKATPPPDFIFIPFGLIHALVGGLLILYPLPGFVKLGHRIVEQGLLLSSILAIGAYLGPRLLQKPAEDPPATPARLLLNISTGLLLFCSFWIEAGYAEAPGKLLRALVVSIHLLRTLPLFRRPARPLWNLYLLQLSFWCIPAGLWLAGLFPDYEILALHLTFIGGFSLLSFTIASRVIAAHCGFENLWSQNKKTILATGICLILAALTRMVSDLFTDYYFGMLHIAAGFWITGAIIWGVVFIPKLTHVSDKD